MFSYFLRVKLHCGKSPNLEITETLYPEIVVKNYREKYECDVGEREMVSVYMSLFKKKKKSSSYKGRE